MKILGEGVTSTEGELVPTGAIMMFGSATPPTGYLVCDGASLLRAGTYAALFAVIGTTYGSVDGTHFTLPNLASAFPRGNTPASNGGAATHTLTSAEMPAHTHTQTTHNHTQTTHNHTQDTHNHTQNSHNHTQTTHNHQWLGSSTGWYGYADYAAAGTLSGVQGISGAGSLSDDTESVVAVNVAATATNVTAVATNQTTVAVNQTTVAVNQNTGGDGSHNNLPPYIGVSFIIKI